MFYFIMLMLMYSWNKTGNQYISIVKNLLEWKLNLREDSLGPDNNNIGCNIEYSKYGVCQFRADAKSVLNKAFVAVASVHVPNGDWSFIENIKSSRVVW